MDIIDSFPNYRKQINWKIREHFQDPQLPFGLRLKQIGCNFDPTLYLQPFLSIISSLSINLKESEEDTMLGLVFGLSQSMASAMFGTIATKYLLREFWMGKESRNVPRYGKVGYLLHKKILWVDQKIKTSRINKGIASKWGTPKRFSKRNTMHEFNVKSWDNFMVRMKMAIASMKKSMEMLKEEKKSNGDKLKAMQYQKLFGVVKQIPKVGPLNANHLLGLMSLCGVIPVIMFEEEEGGAKKAYMQLDEQHSLKEKKFQKKK